MTEPANEMQDNVYMISMDKEEIPETELTTGSYFETLKNTNIGGKSVELSLEEMFILMFPSIDFVEMTDKYIINKNNMSMVLIKKLCDLGLEHIFDESKIKDEDLRTSFLKYKIENTENYDFLGLGKLLIGCVFNNNNTKILLSAKNKTGTNIFTYLCKYQYISIARQLLELYGEYCGIDNIDNSGNTPLIWCCINNNNFGLVLIEKFKEKCMPKHANNSGHTALICACYAESTVLAFKLIEEFKEDCSPEHVNNYGDTALLWCCDKKLVDIATKLIDEFKEKCNPGAVNDRGNTALIVAIHEKTEPVAFKIIDNLTHICSPFIQNKKGNTAFMIAKILNLENIVKKLKDTYGDAIIDNI